MSDIEREIASFVAGRRSRRSFIRRLLALGCSAAFIEALIGEPVTRALAATGPAPPNRPNFVLVVMDACRRDYLNLAPMPNLQWLMSQGTTYTNAWVGQLESYTPASHATLSTGAFPAHSGVLGFEWRDPKTGKEDYTAWYPDVMAGRLEQQLTQHGVNSIPRAIKGSDSKAKVVAVSGEKYYAADAMGGHAADYIFFGLPVGKTIVPTGIPHHVPPQQVMKDSSITRAWPLHYEQYDELAMTMALVSLQKISPRALMINLPALDTYGHRVGGPATRDVMTRLIKNCDVQLGRLIQAYKDRGTFDQTVFVVVGDHGMVPNTHQIDDSMLKDAIRAGGGNYLFHTGGNCAYVWLNNPSKAGSVAKYVLDALQHIPFAHHMKIKSGKNVYTTAVRPGTTMDPGLAAAYEYLLGTFAGPLSPDIMFTFEENTITRVHSAPHGEHGGATWGAQQIPLVIAGPGVAKGKESSFPARLVDVAPTVLALLGIAATDMDGVVLADGLTTPTDAQGKAQADLATNLTNYQKAIIARSTADTGS